MDKVSNHTLSNFKDGGDLTPLFKKQENPKTSFDKKRKPLPLTEEQKKDDLERDIYKEKVKFFVTRDCNLTRNMEKFCGVIWGQCSAALHAKIKGLSDYEISSFDLDIVWLIREIKKIVSGIDKKSDPRMPLIHAIGTLYRMKQGATETNDK